MTFHPHPNGPTSQPGLVLRRLAVLGLLSISSAAFALSIELPTETAALRSSTLPGYLLAQQNCLVCHSAQYLSTQPPGLPHSFWEAEVKKMKTTYGAQFPDEDIPAIADYLTKAYGAEAAK
jgi:sulfite dehydrogenase